MSEVLTWAAYGGLGQLGSHLRHELAAKEHIAQRFNLEQLPEFIVQRQKVLSSDASQTIAGQPGELCLPDIAFITLPSAEDSQVAFGYMEELLENGVLVVTAEKQALADRFAELRDLSDNFSLLGINAAVGGGMRAMEASRVYTAPDPANVAQLHGGLNASTNFILEQVEAGVSLEVATSRAVGNGYADPGAEADPTGLLINETADFAKKIPTFLNRLGILPRLLGPQDIPFSLSAASAEQLGAEPWRRPVVSAYNPALTADQPEADNLGGEPREIEGWVVAAGYRDMRQKTLFQKEFSQLTGAGNAVVIQLGPGGEDSPLPIVLKGTGAGLGPTVNTLLDDSMMLRKNLS